MFRPLATLLAGAVLAGCGTSAPHHPRRHGGPGAESRAGHSPAASPPVTVGADTVTVLPCGEEAFARIRTVVEGARRVLHLEMYELDRADLVEAMEAAGRRGVAVTVIVDPTVDVTAATEARLRAGGIDVLDYPVRKQMIDHVKLLVADAAGPAQPTPPGPPPAAVVGGINWGRTSARNHDFDALLTGPAVANLDRIFLRDLATAGRPAAVPPPVPDTAVRVASTIPGPDIRPLVLGVVAGARTTLDADLFVLTDTTVVTALLAAHDRGVAVRVLLDPGQHPSDDAAARLRDGGVEVRLYRSRGERLHAKAAVADGSDVVFGSANWTTSGFERNHEVDVEIASPAVARAFEDQMTADWARSG